MEHNKPQKIEKKTNYNPIEKNKKSAYIINLNNAKEELLKYHPSNAIFYLVKAEETNLVLKLYNEVLPKICIDNIKQCLELLEEDVAPSEKIFREFEDIFYHKVAKMSLLFEDDGQKPRTPFYILISKFCANMYALLEDYRTLNYLKFINDEEKRKQIEQLADKEFSIEEKNETSDNEEYWKQYKKKQRERLSSIEKIREYLSLIKKFLKEVGNMKENETNAYEVMEEITQNIIGKIELTKSQ